MCFLVLLTTFRHLCLGVETIEVDREENKVTMMGVPPSSALSPELKWWCGFGVGVVSSVLNFPKFCCRYKCHD
jgi:hypothetical protein